MFCLTSMKAKALARYQRRDGPQYLGEFHTQEDGEDRRRSVGNVRQQTRLQQQQYQVDVLPDVPTISKGGSPNAVSCIDGAAELGRSSLRRSAARSRSEARRRPRRL
ncbi:unnamed protein product [Prorocentrum cordatum]|uniref:Uncharacterized protein n=1 Tax=Prorocentrum cordatum TaxID=2364126 RepID=A0ABN9Q5Y9_9DINO|nr:unnamed protein product [Polarella glacialis]